MKNYQKKILTSILSVFLFGASSLAAQEVDSQAAGDAELSRRFAVSIGFLKGGGALVGADFEWMFADNLALSLGGGYLGASAGLNYHFEPDVESAYVGLFFWDQNIGNTDWEQMSAGVLVGTRLFGFLTGELGVGYVIQRGPAVAGLLGADVPVMLVYNIGVYFAF